jgi:hypothetical protein
MDIAHSKTAEGKEHRLLHRGSEGDLLWKKRNFLSRPTGRGIEELQGKD